MQYVDSILDNRALLTAASFQDTLMNPLDAQIKLFDLTVCQQIAFEPLDQETVILPSMSAMPASYEKATSFNATMVFTQFFSNPAQVETQAWFYSRGVRNDNPIKMNLGSVKKIKDNQREALQVKFNIPNQHKNEIYSNSEAVFAVRIKIDEHQQSFFPYHQNGRERWLGAKIKLKDFNIFTDLSQDENIKIAPMDELKKSFIW
ncbi:hypothetical protein GCM10009117_25790 [Gangjinia marincola]|uniref:Uncharacterized protein n=1 Tax=Gangjinia marincola TaxID=578463 RepID=A0ABP3XXX0_9FLAO